MLCLLQERRGELKTGDKVKVMFNPHKGLHDIKYDDWVGKIVTILRVDDEAYNMKYFTADDVGNTLWLSQESVTKI